jgi:hypothetical protein
MSQLDALLDAIGAAPVLPGAKCRGRHHLVAARHTQALGLCSHCPALDRCADFIDSLPKRKRPGGVVGGQINRGSEERERRQPGRPRKAVS